MKVYLDHNATTPIHPFVLQEMMPYYKNSFGNPSSIHSFGREAKRGMEEARERVVKAISAEPEEIVFTSGGTESNNLAIKGIAYANKDKGNHIITSKIEHPAVLNPCGVLEEEGFKVTYLEVDRFGMIHPLQVLDALRKETILITIMYANNEVGTIQPIQEVAQIVKERDVYFHTDAVQGIGRIEVSVEKLGVDLLSLSSHKICGPKGVGALYIRKGVKIDSIIQGGHHERGRRAGTENVPGIVGFGKAAELATSNLEENKEHLTRFRDKLYNGIIERIDDTGLNGHPTLRLPNTFNISFKGIEGESLMVNLDLKGIACSTGSACTIGSLEPSHVLRAMGVSEDMVHGSLRFSLGIQNTEEEIDYTIKVLADVVERLRDISPLYVKSK